MRGCTSPLYRPTHFLESRSIGVFRDIETTIPSSMRTSEKAKERMGPGCSKKNSESSQEFYGLFSRNRDQCLGVEIVSPTHQSFQGGSFTGRL